MWSVMTGVGSPASSSACSIPSVLIGCCCATRPARGCGRTRVAVGLLRAWYAALVATPILGEQVVAYRGFIPWFLRLGRPAGLFSDADARLYADPFCDRARAAATSRLYRSHLHLVRAILLRHALRANGSRLQPGCCSALTTSTSPWRCWRRSRPTEMT
jgi:hypothetical protein